MQQKRKFIFFLLKQVRLIRPLRLDEVEAAEIESEKSRDRLKEENYIVDCDKAKQVCSFGSDLKTIIID